MYITRDEAVTTLYDVINSGIISEELEERLEDIASCIEHEEQGLFTWGADDDVIDLFVAKREDLYTPEWEQHCNEIWEKYRIREEN